jgi:hypothetical protein
MLEHYLCIPAPAALTVMGKISLPGETFGDNNASLTRVVDGRRHDQLAKNYRNVPLHLLRLNGISCFRGTYCSATSARLLHCMLCCLPAGVLAVKRVGGVPTVFPADSGEVSPEEDMLQVR